LREAPSDPPCPALPCLPLYLSSRSPLCPALPGPLITLATQRALKTKSAEGAPRTEARGAGVRLRGAKRRMMHNVPLYLASRSTLCTAQTCPLIHLAPQRENEKRSAEGAPRIEARSAEGRLRGANRRGSFAMSRSTLPPAPPCLSPYLVSRSTLPPDPPCHPACD
jgi:hypothetical protein